MIKFEKSMAYSLHWSEESERNLINILDYLHGRWSHKEVNQFKKKLRRQLDLIISNPYLFPKSEFQPRLRKAVLSKQTTIFYEIKGNHIYLAYIFVNKRNIRRVK